jgi:hypothetical protein
MILLKRKLLNRLIVCSLCCAALIAAPAASAQTGMHPPTILLIQREFLKPGKSGSLHAKTESAFANAMKAAKWPTYYSGMDSISGPSRALFFTAYESMEAFQKDSDAFDKNPTLSAAVDRASIADGELLSSYDQSVWHLRKDLSLGNALFTPATRYFEILQFHTKAGHESEFEEVAKMYVAAYAKADPDANWATFDNVYGFEDGGVYLVIFPRKSLAEVDKGFSDGPAVMAAIGSSGQKKIAELSAASVASSQSNIFRLNPKLSYLSDEFTSGDPGFWKPKPAPAKPAPPAKPQ